MRYLIITDSMEEKSLQRVAEYFISDLHRYNEAETAANGAKAKRNIYLEKNMTKIEEIIDERIDFNIVQGNSLSDVRLFAVITFTYYRTDK